MGASVVKTMMLHFAPGARTTSGRQSCAVVRAPMNHGVKERLCDELPDGSVN